MFFYSWNDYYGPLLYTSENPSNWPVSLRARARSAALHQVQTGTSRWPRPLIVMMPVVLIFFLAQRVFVEGITLTGVKG